MLLVPSDDALLAELAEFNATSAGGWADDVGMLRQLAARHVLLTQHQRGLDGRAPLPSLAGTPAVTEAAQSLQLFLASQAGEARVRALGAEPQDYPILETRRGCYVTVLQIEGALAGPAPPAPA